MKKLLVIFMMILLLGCSEVTYQTITASDAKENLDSDKEIILLDVRTQLEYDEGFIPGATLAPLDELSGIESIYEDKDATYYVYCRSGRRSKLAAEQLIELGYTSVYDMGGIIDWPYEVTVE